MTEASDVDLASLLEKVTQLDPGDVETHLPVFEEAHAALRTVLTQASQPPAS
jgi:hypothetical protein